MRFVFDWYGLKDLLQLLQSRFRSISRTACVPKIILGLTSSEITRERSDPAAQAGNCPAPPSYADRP